MEIRFWKANSSNNILIVNLGISKILHYLTLLGDSRKQIFRKMRPCWFKEMTQTWGSIWFLENLELQHARKGSWVTIAHSDTVSKKNKISRFKKWEYNLFRNSQQFHVICICLPLSEWKAWWMQEIADCYGHCWSDQWQFTLFTSSHSMLWPTCTILTIWNPCQAYPTGNLIFTCSLVPFPFMYDSYPVIAFSLPLHFALACQQALYLGAVEKEKKKWRSCNMIKL